MREYLDKKEKNLIMHCTSAVYWGKQVGMYPSGKYKSFTTRDNVFVIEGRKCTEHWWNKTIENYFFVKENNVAGNCNDVICNTGLYGNCVIVTWLIIFNKFRIHDFT